MTAMQATVEVRLSKTYFAKGLKYAKKFGGQYNPDRKTWAIPADRPELRAPGAYGWVRVAPEIDPTDLGVGVDPMVANSDRLVIGPETPEL